MADAVEIQDLVVAYRHRRVLNGFSLKVRPGEIFGFLGPNGAGKTTTIKTLLGLLQPSLGKVLVHGRPPTDARARSRMGFLPEEATYYPYLTPVELLYFYGRIFRIPRRVLEERIHRLLDLVGLAEARTQKIRTLSKGMTQKVSLAQALINDADTLILDEPTSGLDPLARLGLRKILKDLKHAGKTIFFSSHELSEAELICDAVAIIHEGRIVRQGSLDEVLGHNRDQNLERFFLDTIKGEGA